MYFDKVKELIVDTLSLDEADITMEASLKDDLSVDSLDAMEVVLAIEEEYGITIPPETLATFVKVEDIVKYLESNVQ